MALAIVLLINTTANMNLRCQNPKVKVRLRNIFASKTVDVRKEAGSISKIGPIMVQKTIKKMGPFQRVSCTYHWVR